MTALQQRCCHNCQKARQRGCSSGLQSKMGQESSWEQRHLGAKDELGREECHAETYLCM